MGIVEKLQSIDIYGKVGKSVLMAGVFESIYDILFRNHKNSHDED